MPAWAYWTLFLVAGAFALVAAKRLDDLERKRWDRDLKGRRDERT